ncbi:helicase, partial [Streptomyces zaomyceticus]
KLRDHQVEAVAAIVRGLDIPPGGIPVNGLRGHTPRAGRETIIAAASAKRLVPKGRILVLVPTLDLLTQTVRAWREVGHVRPAVAVCSLQDDPELWSLRVRSTTNPVQLALWRGSGREHPALSGQELQGQALAVTQVSPPTRPAPAALAD